MPGCDNVTDSFPDVTPNCSLPSNCSIPSDTSPAPVNNLTVAGKSNSTVTLVWESPPCPSSACRMNPADSWNMNCTAHLYGLRPGQEYTVMMYRITEAGGCNWSTPINVTTRPSPVWNVTVQNRTVDSLKIAWMPPENSSAYRYNICLSNNTWKSNCSSSTENSYTAGGLEAGALYTVIVYAVTSNNVSSVGTVLPDVITLPNKPKNIKVTKCSTHNLTISWDPPKDSNASDYLYRVFWVRDNTMDPVKNQSTSASSYTINGLLPGSIYTVKLVSVINDAESATVENWILTNPLPPPNFRVNTVNQSAVNLFWGLPDPAFSGFGLQVWKGPTEILENHTFPNNTSTFVLNTLSPGTKYNFTLFTVAEGRGLSTHSTNVLLEGATKPEPVSNLKCFPVGGGYRLKVSWTCGTGGVSQYLVIVSGRDPVKWLSCEDPVEVGNLQPAQTYLVQVATLWNELRTNSSQVRCDTASAGVIAGAVFGLLILLVLLGLLLFYFRRWREKISKKPKANVEPPCVLASVSVSAFPCYCCEHFSDSAFGFAKEYQQLQDTGTGQPHTVAEYPENREKNRYSNVLPYDSSRVLLGPSISDPNSDYINASYIPGYHREKEYIATQGPLPGTLHDVWRMIWEQRITTLVMLTNCIENGRVKCERYWPLDYTPCTYEDITVSVVIETILPDWTIRDFNIKRKNEWEVRLARHYHYTSWPDHGVPSNTSAILHFRDLVRKHIEQHTESGPALVHCSAGVGRTGTFIALDSLLSQAQKEGQIGVYSFVQRMRMNRPLMIQTESQYVFLHQCLLDRIQPPSQVDSEKMQSAAVYENTLAFQDYEVSRPLLLNLQEMFPEISTSHIILKYEDENIRLLNQLDDGSTNTPTSLSHVCTPISRPTAAAFSVPESPTGKSNPCSDLSCREGRHLLAIIICLSPARWFLIPFKNPPDVGPHARENG
ncbi:receptor-type tyrosine-protein phosphatase H [Eublepharis macularius]|uniref:protein-tyrosine-phosphatase n=1 Tax=Eublepharis macularius TaxID=481883 RepID=A0AA97K7N5_EUBMA|nr:receptor-type tyrosine-protein phosphatase H [Eublepharis macularius]